MKVDIKFKDIPHEILDQVMQHVQHYLVTMVAFSPDHRDRPMQLAGSGTLVRIEDAFGILTAAHVWDIARRADRVFIPFGTRPGGFSIATADFNLLEIWSHDDEHWGPDLALLRIPEAVVGDIAATKSFLNLPRQKERLGAHPPMIDKGFWAVVGMVGDLSKVEANVEEKIATARIEGRAYFGGIDQHQVRGDWDYLDVGADMELPDTPGSFGGLSGGALWQVDLAGDAEKKPKWTGRAHFRGVIFWQSPEVDRRRAIRCHGPRSIFDTMWARWGLPVPPAPQR